jgi:pSer/pThr/pTyr-binding forkhead associated (FHA) protein
MPTAAPSVEVTTQIGVPLPRTNGRERRRAAITAPQLPPGRYLAIEDAGEVVVIEVAEETVHLGRSTAADVMLEHMSVSRRHAVIARRGEDHVVLDDRSLNGVVVNGERVREAVLHHGDEIRLGDVAIRFLDVP